MYGGTFGFVGRVSGLISLKNCLLPKAVSIESRYTYLQGRHWLLPVVWGYRFFKTRNTWSYHAKEAKSIMNTDTDEVLKLKRIYKEIGL